MQPQPSHNGVLTRRLAVLVVTSDTPLSKEGVDVYAGTASGAGWGTPHYIDLLSSSNMRWDILAPADVCRSTFVSDGTIRYSAVIFAAPLASLTGEQMATVKDMAFEHGISIIATYDLPDCRIGGYFGIRSFRGRKWLMPLKVRILNWPHSASAGEVTADYGLTAGLSGLRKGGFRKLSLKRTLTKGIGLLKSLSVRYMTAEPHPGVQVLATTISGTPVAWSYRFGRATNYYFALDHRTFLLKFNEMHRLMRSVLMANSGQGMAGVCLDRTMVVRLDDPGACKTDHLDTGKLLNETDWEELATSLHAHNIPLSVMYTPGWVDDGDCSRGSLYLNGVKTSKRAAGGMHDSAGVTYIPSSGRQESYDHSSEYRGLKRLLEKDLLDIHSHGLTHLDTDYQAWANAPDKGTDSRWYHEFFHVKKGSPVEKESQMHALTASREKIEELFEVAPYAFTPSGHIHDPDCDLLAHNAGYSLFSSDYTGIGKDNLLVRNMRLVSVFLFYKEPTGFAAAAGYPVIGVVHDYEIKNNVSGFIATVSRWKQKGIDRFITLRDVTASLCATLDAHYRASESMIVVDIEYSERLINCRRYFTLAGALVPLHVCMPANVKISDEPVSTSNGTVASVVRDESGILLSLELREALSYRVKIPVTPVF